ncbi:MAG TPA: hypothetical protein ENN28_00080 [Candidatus Uhrbacteria bacterium]|nr:hypothetical protein [Candidatus Uhrbacteria bacterium]
MGLKSLIQSITKKEWHWVIFLIVAMILITTAPYIYAYLNTPAGYFYNGIHALTPGDLPVYFSYINQAKEGDWILKNNFTSEFQEQGLLNLFWLKIGLLARLFNLSPALAFQIARIFLLALLFLILYVFICYFFEDKFKRKFSLIFLAFASGIGAYAIPFLGDPHTFYRIHNWPIDLWITDSNMFLAAYHSPHLIMSLICMISFFLLGLLSLEKKQYFYAFFAGLVGLYWFNFHPYYFPLAFLVLFFYSLYLFVKHPRVYPVFNFFIILILSLPFVFYHFYKLQTDEMVSLRAAQNITLLPNFPYIFLGYGFIFVMAIIAVVYLIKTRQIFGEKYIFLLSWITGSFIMLYLPFQFQRRYFLGLIIPLALLNVVVFAEIFKWLKNKYNFNILKNKILLGYLFLIFFGFSNFFNLVRDVYYFNASFQKFYLPKEYQEAVLWLKENNFEKKVVFSYEYTSGQIPALVNQPVYLSHSDHETLFYSDKKIKVDNFLAGIYGSSEEIEFLKQNNIGYLFFSDLEKKSASYQPQEKQYLNKVFKKGEIEIYEFIN